MRSFRDIIEVRVHLEQEAERARKEQERYLDIEADLGRGLTDSQIGTRYGVRGISKTTARSIASQAGSRAFAYEDAVKALTEVREHVGVYEIRADALQVGDRIRSTSSAAPAPLALVGRVVDDVRGGLGDELHVEVAGISDRVFRVKRDARVTIDAR